MAAAAAAAPASCGVGAGTAMSMAAGGTIHVSGGPCLGMHMVPFYLELRFNPSLELLRQKTLYDGDVEDVANIGQIEFFWTSDDAFDELRVAPLWAAWRRSLQRIALTVRGG